MECIIGLAKIWGIRRLNQLKHNIYNVISNVISNALENMIYKYYIQDSKIRSY